MEEGGRCDGVGCDGGGGEGSWGEGVMGLARVGCGGGRWRWGGKVGQVGVG